MQQQGLMAWQDFRFMLPVRLLPRSLTALHFLHQRQGSMRDFCLSEGSTLVTTCSPQNIICHCQGLWLQLRHSATCRACPSAGSICAVRHLPMPDALPDAEPALLCGLQLRRISLKEGPSSAQERTAGRPPATPSVRGGFVWSGQPRLALGHAHASPVAVGHSGRTVLVCAAVRGAPLPLDHSRTITVRLRGMLDTHGAAGLVAVGRSWGTVPGLGMAQECSLQLGHMTVRFVRAMLLLVLPGARASMTVSQVLTGSVCVCCPVLKQPHPCPSSSPGPVL